MLCHIACVIHLTSSYDIGIYYISSQEGGLVQYNKILRERDHVLINFITAYYYCFVFIINLLLCLICKLNFNHKHVCIGVIVVCLYRVQYLSQFQTSTGGLGIYSLRKEVDGCILRLISSLQNYAYLVYILRIDVELSRNILSLFKKRKMHTI